MRSLRFWLLISGILMVSCAPSLTRSDTQLREKARSLIASSYPSEYPLLIGRFRNKSKNKDVDYLAQAIPDILEGLLRPAGKERAYIDLSQVSPVIPKDLNALITSTNDLFSAYATNMASQLTQYQAVIERITNETIQNTTNAVTIAIRTNEILTNLVMTNIAVFNKKLYLSFITNEFPGLVDELSYIPVSVINNSRQTNQVTNKAVYSVELWGEYTVISSRSGPNQVRITVTVETRNESTNRRELVVNCREDAVADRMADILKDIRQELLNRPNGDLMIITEPADANIYLDGSYIGKSPLYYPAIPQGTHSLVLLKEGYQQGRLEFKIVPDRTNFISTTINSRPLGGRVEIQSQPTNAQVFLDSLYVGLTPLILTNLELNQAHRIKILTDNAVLKPHYQAFYLRSAEQDIRINAKLKDFEGFSDQAKKRAWGLTYGAWGLTLGIIGANIYFHYQKEHYQDLQSAYGSGYENGLSLYTSLEGISFTAGIISGIVAGTMTAFALYRQDVFLGFELGPHEPAAVLSVRF